MNKEVKYCRHCYDHLAGKIGVAVTEKLVEKGFIELKNKAFEPTEKGNVFFREMGMNINDLRKKKRSFSRACLDNSEKRFHLAGALGADFLSKMIEKKWLQWNDDTRAIYILPEGKKQFKEIFNLEL